MYGPTKYLMMYTYIPSTPLQLLPRKATAAWMVHQRTTAAATASTGAGHGEAGYWFGTRGTLRAPTNPVTPSSQNSSPFLQRRSASPYSFDGSPRAPSRIRRNEDTNCSWNRRAIQRLIPLDDGQTLSFPLIYPLLLLSHTLSSLFNNLRTTSLHPFLSWSDFKK